MPALLRDARLFTIALAACTANQGQHQSDKLIDVARAVCPAPGLFEHAVCVCGDLTQVGELHVKEGPAGIGSVGVNGETHLVAAAEVVGDWRAWGGFTATGTSIGQNLITPRNVSFTGDAVIDGDAIIGGNLHAVGTLGVLGSLNLGGTEEILGEAAIAARGAYAGLPPAPPCGCDPSSLFDVETAVAGARQATNGTPSWEHVGSLDVHLPTGSYYVIAAQLVGDGVFTVEGNVSVFVDGDLRSVGAARWDVLPGSTLDLFVSGDVESVGDLVAGNAGNSGDFRLYIGGAAASVGTTTFFGSIYAPNADVEYVGDARIVGAIFAKSLMGTGILTIEYGDPITAPQSCTEPPGDDSGESEGSEPTLL